MVMTELHILPFYALVAFAHRPEALMRAVRDWELIRDPGALSDILRREAQTLSGTSIPSGPAVDLARGHQADPPAAPLAGGVDPTAPMVGDNPWGQGWQSHAPASGRDGEGRPPRARRAGTPSGSCAEGRAPQAP